MQCLCHKSEVSYKEDFETKINELVRDLTSILPMSKSEARIRIGELVTEAVSKRNEEVKDLIVKEANIARSEGEKTSRLTSLYNMVDSVQGRCGNIHAVKPPGVIA